MAGAAHQPSKPPLDLRVSVYQCVKYCLLLAACVMVIKFLFFDTVAIKTDQMAPILMEGDRVLTLRTPFTWPFNKFLRPGRAVPVVFTQPLLHKKYACLRVAGLPGDSMVISKGVLILKNRRGISFGKPMAAGEALPYDYSPRDTMSVFRLPAPGDTLDLDSLPLRDFFFAAAMAKQESAGNRYRVRPRLFIDGQPAAGFTLADFSLFKGALDSVPEQYDFDWFFWDRLREYCSHTLSGRDVALDFGLFNGSEKVTEYRVKKSFIFLLADDWRTGFDSRYFGPVAAESFKGRPLCVLWSWAHAERGFGSLRMGRLIKIVK